MRILVLLYPGFAEFEATLLGFVARQEGHEIVTAPAGEAQVVTGMGGFTVTAALSACPKTCEGYDALLVPGGEWEEIIDRSEVGVLVRSFHGAGKVVAAICSGPIQLAKAGILAGKSYTTSLSRNHRDLFAWDRKVDAPVVVDGNIVTAMGEAFVEFTFTFLEALRAYDTPGAADEWRQEFGCPRRLPS